MAWLWTRTRLLGTIQNLAHTEQLILYLVRNRMRSSLIPKSQLIQLCPDWQRISTWKCMIHFPTQFFSLTWEHWETAVTKKFVVFVPLYTLCGKVQNCTESLQVMYIVTKKMFATFYHLITNNRFVTMHKL
jgi:hypothetical protein